MLLVVITILCDVAAIAAVWVVNRVSHLVSPLQHEIASEGVAPVFPKNDILQAGSSTPVGDRVAKHNTKGPEGDLLERIDVPLRNERTTVVNHGDVRMVGLRCRGPKVLGVSDNSTFSVHGAERL